MSINQYNKINSYGSAKSVVGNRGIGNHCDNIDTCNNHGNIDSLYNKIHSPGNTKRILLDIDNENKKGKLHILYNKYGEKYGYNENLIIPYFDEINKKYTDLIVLNNPNDVENIVSSHVKKSPYLTKNLYDSIISTTSVESWKDQRRDYGQAFSLEHYKDMIKVSNKRTKVCISLLNEMISKDKQNDGVIDMYNFLLNETLAQLQLALLGVSDEFQQQTNPRIRASFRGEDNAYAREYAFHLLHEVKSSKCPLGKIMAQRQVKKNKRQDFGNALIFTFAGHDTTANTLTWLIFELCRNNDYYKRFQTEVDRFWKGKENDSDSDINYEDFKKLPFMTCVIMETLRLWTSIPNGTTRELLNDDYIIGKNNRKVKVPKGTYIQIPNWTRHRNPILWGVDCNKFNPFREFKEEENWNNSIFASYNPATNRFSPFTYGPRDCIGKNFSQIEMRIILLNLFKNFRFSVTEQQLKKYNDENISFNSATLAPRNINNKTLNDSSFAMYFKVESINNQYSKL